MTQYVFSIEPVPGGLTCCIAYTTQSQTAVAVSRKQHENEIDALNDVIEQLGVQTTVQPGQAAPPAGIPSAAAGGVR